MIEDVIIPEVTALQQNARFYRENGADLVEISFVGEKDTVIRRVTPEHMARFRDQWNAYCDGSPIKQRVGTPLADIQGMNDQLVAKFVSQNVHTAEELSVLTDGQCQALGHGVLTFRGHAKRLLEARKAQAAEATVKKISSLVAAPMPEMEEKFASKDDVEAVKSEMGELKAMMGQMMEMMQKRGPGRPKTKTEEPEA